MSPTASCLELAKALAINPRVLILDEPTAALGADAVDALFDEVRRAAAAGTAVVYITHRLAEVRQIADRVTVLRDGAVQGAALVSDITDEEILRMIVGRTVESVFPPKRSGRESASPVLRVEELSGDGFESVSFEVQPGRGRWASRASWETARPRSCAPSLGWPTPPARCPRRWVTARSAAHRLARSRRRVPAGRPARRRPAHASVRAGERQHLGPQALRASGVINEAAERATVSAERRALNIRTASLEAPSLRSRAATSRRSH